MAKGQLLARDRVELLLDEDSPFLELCALAGFEQEGMSDGGSTVAGIGLVCGVECVVSANVPTLKGGSVNEATLVKGARIAEIAWENRLPLVNLIQSAGADLSQQERVFHRGGGSFRNLAQRSKLGLTSVAVVFGSSTAGGAYTPGMSDYTVMVKEQAKVFLGGPPLVRMATGEEVDDETLGGAEMHSKVSGVSDYLAADEPGAIQKAREIVAHLGWRKSSALPTRHLCGSAIDEPAYPIDELLGIVPANVRKPFDAREVIARIVDGSRIAEFKPAYGANMVTAFAAVHGVPVGIVANNGVIFPAEANKATQFIALCNQKSTPLVFLHNVTGFMVGSKYERDGIIKAGARFINAVANSEVPAITVVMGASYGAGNYAMSGRAYKPRFLFSWPNSKCSVMGPEQLTGVLDIIMRAGAARRGIELDEDIAAQRKHMFREQVEHSSDVFYTSSRCIDDGVIDPRDTRHVLSFCLSIVFSGHVQGGNLYGVSRM
jgi:acyl-CoA carboxylase subunit beta